jgi:hypothetical protein
LKLFLYLRASRWLPLWTAILFTSTIAASGQHEAMRPASRHSAAPTGEDQIKLERHAIRLLARPDLQQELKSLETKWKERWPDLLPSTLKQANSSIEELAFLVALETIDDDPRRPYVVQISMSPHTWFGTDVPGGRWGIDNPDTQYFLVPLETSSSYIIIGKRHAPGPVDSNFSFSNLDGWRTLANIAHDQLQISPDDTYTITLDSSPANGRSNHIQLTEGGDFLLIRNTLADWSRESADHLEIKRLSGPPPTAEPTEEALEHAFVVRLRTLLDHVIANLQAPVFKVPVNVLPQPGKPGDKAGFLVTQRNALGHFRLQEDEALVVTVNPGGAEYATLPVTNVWGVSPAYWEHQSSLNNQQALKNADGTITLVVSAFDPGIANWIDTAGLEEGFIMLRWQRLHQSTEGPEVHSVMVKRKDLAAHIPTGIVLFSPHERAEQLRKRKDAFQLRFEE